MHCELHALSEKSTVISCKNFHIFKETKKNTKNPLRGGVFSCFLGFFGGVFGGFWEGFWTVFFIANPALFTNKKWMLEAPPA